jgi:hypothetical protein
VTLIFFVIVATSNNLYAQHKKYSEKDMPASVITSFQKNFPDAIVRGYDKETEDGVTSYEVEATIGDIKKDIQFDAEGNVIEIEETMNTADLPEKVVTAINNKYSNPTILKSEKVTKGADILYEVLIKAKKKKYEVRLDKEGNIVEVE